MKMELGNEKTKYNLGLISEEQFNDLHDFVRAVFDQGRQRFKSELRIISNDASDFPGDREYLQNCGSLGVCMEPQGAYQKYFNIWISPNYAWPSRRFYMTVAHELTHGYAGLKYGHNAHWRRWFYRVWFHLNKANFLPWTSPDPMYDLLSVEHQYNQTVTIDPVLTIREALNKADKEHDQVMENYLMRLKNAACVDCS